MVPVAEEVGVAVVAVVPVVPEGVAVVAVVPVVPEGVPVVTVVPTDVVSTNRKTRNLLP